VKTENQTKFDEIIKAVFELPDAYDPSDVKKDALASWDSLGHVSLVAALESEFGISIDTNEMERATDLDAVKSILTTKGL